MNISPTGYNVQTGYGYYRNTTGTDIKSGIRVQGDQNAPPGQDGTQKTVQPTTKPVEYNESSRNSSNKDQQQPLQQDKKINGEPLTDTELRMVKQLKQVDAEVRRHEMAHIAAGGRYITSGANFAYKRGPDGINYAVAGEVGIDTSPVPGDPEATMQKMRQIKASALAPANPSPQDIKVAAKATSLATKAMSDLMMLQAQEKAGRQKGEFTNLEAASDSYIRVNNLPESDTSTFKLAV